MGAINWRTVENGKEQEVCCPSTTQGHSACYFSVSALLLPRRHPALLLPLRHPLLCLNPSCGVDTVVKLCVCYESVCVVSECVHVCVTECVCVTVCVYVTVCV